ncbi:MAG: type ii secretion system integral membrane subunit, partial [Rhodococcus sp. (in: high G+C Gram-positive bacteria)]
MTALGMILWATALLALPGRRVRLQSLRRKRVSLRMGKRSHAGVLVASTAVIAMLLASVGGVYLLSAAAIVAGTFAFRRRAVLRRRAHDTEVDSLVAGLETVVG